MDRSSERKRKRTEKVEANRRIDDQTKAKATDSAAEEVAVPPPSEEEVEEFFAILRRMRFAVKYFEKEGKSGGDEAEVAADGGGKRAVGLDLNAVPEAESSLV